MARYARALAAIYPVLFGGRKYSQSLLSLFSGNIMAYWPLWEPSGAVAYDISGNGLNGSYTGVTLGQPGIGDGHTSPLFDGANDVTNAFSAGLAAAFGGLEGTLAIWAKVSAASVWSDATFRYLIYLTIDSNNQLTFYKGSVANRIEIVHKAGGVQKIRLITVSSTAWMHFALTWSTTDDVARVFMNGTQQGADFTELGLWSGAALVRALIGAGSTTPSNVWNGYLAHALLLDRAATPAEIAQAAAL